LTLLFWFSILQYYREGNVFEEVVKMVYQYTEAAEAVGATVKRFSSMTGIRGYLQEQIGAEKVAVSALPDEYAALRDEFPQALPGEYPSTRCCLSVARAGIARTGTLLLDLGDPTGRSATALALIHLVLLKESAIVSDLGSAAPLLEAYLESGTTAYISLTTGPSRTADIERVLTIGVHGPGELHILIQEGV
jgi:L-lactate dehydrogenase complex protein LldG